MTDTSDAKAVMDDCWREVAGLRRTFGGLSGTAPLRECRWCHAVEFDNPPHNDGCPIPALSSEIARREAAELFEEVLGWIVEDNPALVHGYVMGHHALDPISDLPAFFRAFPSVDIHGWMAKHADAMDAMRASLGGGA